MKEKSIYWTFLKLKTPALVKILFRESKEKVQNERIYLQKDILEENVWTKYKKNF